MDAEIDAARSGDPVALRRLFDRYQPRVMGYCMLSANGDRDLAMDLTQETFTRAFKSLHSLAEDHRFTGWLFTIAANVCRTQGAKAKRRQEILDSFALELEVEIGDDKEARERRIAAVHTVLGEIDDPVVREIALLKYTEPEHTTRQIAAKLGIPHGTVTVKLMRFRAAIRKRMLVALLDVEEQVV